MKGASKSDKLYQSTLNNLQETRLERVKTVPVSNLVGEV